MVVDKDSAVSKIACETTLRPGCYELLQVVTSCYKVVFADPVESVGIMLSAARRFLSTPGARAFAARGAAVAAAAAGVGAFSAQCSSIKLTVPVEIDVDQLVAAASREQLEAALKKGKVGTADSLNILLQEDLTIRGGAQLWIMNCGSRLQEAGHNVTFLLPLILSLYAYA
jgi:hypothetical protein